MRFQDVGITDFHAIQSYADKYGENSCQHSFINLFTLQEKYGSQFCIEDGALFVLRSGLCTEKFRTYLFPMGGNRRRAVEAVLEDAHAHNAKARFQTVTDEKRRFLEDAFPGVFQVEESRDYAEYLFETEAMAALRGVSRKRRQGVNGLRRLYGDRLRVEPLTIADVDEALAFARSWLEISRESHDGASLDMEYREMEKQLAHFEALRIAGLIVRIDGRMEAFGYGAPISGDCFDGIIAKGNRSINAVNYLLHQELASLAFQMGLRYMNAEEDLGIPGLRAYKLSYRPAILLDKFIVTEK